MGFGFRYYFRNANMRYDREFGYAPGSGESGKVLLSDDNYAWAMGERERAKEGFTISTRGNMTTVTGNDGNGVIYGCRELIDHVGQYKDLKFPAQLTDAPEMVLRGGCVGIQKMEYLPGRALSDTLPVEGSITPLMVSMRPFSE